MERPIQGRDETLDLFEDCTAKDGHWCHVTLPPLNIPFTSMALTLLKKFTRWMAGNKAFSVQNRNVATLLGPWTSHINPQCLVLFSPAFHSLLRLPCFSFTSYLLSFLSLRLLCSLAAGIIYVLPTSNIGIIVATTQPRLSI